MERDPTYSYNYPEIVDDPICPLCCYEIVAEEGETCGSCERELGLDAGRDLGADADELGWLARTAEED